MGEQRHVDYEDRLAAVTAALAAAEAERRFGEAQALRLAQDVLRGLIQDQRPDLRQVGTTAHPA